MPQLHSDAAPRHYENFPVASLLCPPALRGAIVALYHFARTADDLADEGETTAGERLDALKRYREQLALGAHSPPYAQSEWAWVFGPLHTVLVRHKLPLDLLHALLDAFVQDVDMTARQAGYADEAQLLDYCSRSANPVGRLLLHLYGVRSPQALAQSDAICTALQLINFWQDCGIDLTRGRCYFPADWMRQHGTDQAALHSGESHASEQALIAHCVQHARHLMASGAPLVHQVPGRAGWELRLVVQGGLRVLEKVEHLGAQVLRQRPRLYAPDYLVMLWRALRM
jgi:squalene synthase HpnC